MSIEDVVMEEGVVITHPDLVHLVGCTIGAGSRVGPFVEILGDTTVGRHCKISSHSFICSGVSIGDGVFIGHGVVITDGPLPAGMSEGGTEPELPAKTLRTRIGAHASIGSRVTIRAGCLIGEGALIGAGAVVTRDVPSYTIAVGNPAKVTFDARSSGGKGRSKRCPSGAGQA